MWWSLFIRDRMLALGTRRPMRIQDDSFDVAMLTLEDFDIEPLTEFGHGSSVVPDAEDQKRTALMCIELAKLCVCIGYVLSTQYTTLSTRPAASYTTMVVPRRDGERPTDLQKCDAEIDEWMRQLSSNVWGSPSTPPQTSMPNCAEVHWAMLNLAHLTLVNVLHRTQALQPPATTAEVQDIRRASRLKVKNSARNVTKIAQMMLHRNQVRFLGLNGITALLAACLSHMVDIRTGDDDVRDASIFRFDQSMQVLHSMKNMYATADAAVTFLASVVRKARLPLPAEVAMPAPYFMSASSHSAVQPLAPTNRLANLGETCAQDNLGAGGYAGANFHGASWAVDRSISGSQPTTVTGLNAFPGADRLTLETTTSVPGHSAPNLSRDGFSRNQNLFSFDDALLGAFSDPAANGSSLNWSSAVDSAVDLEPILSNYDFFLDPFGFPDT